MIDRQLESQGFLARPSHSPASFALAFTVTGAGLAALLMSSPYIRDKVIPDSFTAIAIPLPKPIEIEPTKPVAEPKLADPRPSLTPPVSRPTPSTPIIGATDPGPIVTGGGPATDFVTPGPIPMPDPVRIAEPVLVGARYDPRYVRDQQPPYPAAMEREERDGSVTVRVKIGIDGRVLAVEPVQASDAAFFASTRDWALRKWRFKPATRDGVPVESTRTMSVTFTIDRR